MLLVWMSAPWPRGEIGQGYIGSRVHQAIVEQGTLDLVQVQADEIRVKGCTMLAWMGLAMMGSTRWWLGGVVQFSRDRSLADRLFQQVRRCAQALRPLLVLTDGWSASPNSIRRAFREKVKTSQGSGRARLQIWPELPSGTIIKRTEKKRVGEITRRMAHGRLEQAEQLLLLSRGGVVLNTAFIERLNGTCARTASQPDAQVSSCRSSSSSA